MRKLLLSATMLTILTSFNIKTIQSMTHQMPKLPYASDALEPTISKQTVDFHYGKHLQTYVDNTNRLIQGTTFEAMTLEQIVAKSEGPLFNNAAQVWNHTLYFNSFSPGCNPKISDSLSKAINEQWGSMDAFQTEFSAKAVAIFGSGWAWLVCDKAGKLSIRTDSNAGNPVKDGLTALLTFDVWEHSYYLDYQNRRADHIKALWLIVDWSVISERYENQ